MTSLMNVKLECPTNFFIFCNRYHPMTVHNLTFTKTFTSAAFTYCSISSEFLKKYSEGVANYLPYLPVKSDCEVISPYCLTSMNDYRIEYDAEICRKANYPKSPSRLSAVFAFGDYETCKIVAKKYNWDLTSVKRFNLVNNPLNRVIKVNMEIVSLARYAFRISYSEQNELENLWRHYWNGGGNIQMELPNANFSREKIDSGEIFEYLIEGAVTLADGGGK